RLPLHVILPNTHHRRRLLGQSLHFLKDSLKPSIHRKRFPHTSRRGFNKKLTPILRPRILPDHAPNHVVNQTRTSTRSLIVSVLSLIVSSRRWVRQRNHVPQPRHIVLASKVQSLRTIRRGSANARRSTRQHLPALILDNNTPTLFEPGRQNILSVHLKRERGNVIVPQHSSTAHNGENAATFIIGGVHENSHNNPLSVTGPKHFSIPQTNLRIRSSINHRHPNTVI